MNLLIGFAVAAVGGLIGIKVGLPQGALLGALIAIIIVNTTGILATPRLPAPLLFAMYVLIGLELGAGVDRSTFGALSKAWLPAVLFVTLLLAVTVVSSLIMAKFFGLDLATALFGTSPGALSGITAMARQEGANAVVVAAFHTLRVVAIVVATPIIYRILVK